MKKDMFMANELRELEALEIRGGDTPSVQSQNGCINEVAGCGAGVDQTKCVNKENGCGRGVVIITQELQGKAASQVLVNFKFRRVLQN